MPWIDAFMLFLGFVGVCMLIHSLRLRVRDLELRMTLVEAIQDRQREGRCP